MANSEGSGEPPRGERRTLCSPAMSLVLAQMAQEDEDEEGEKDDDGCRSSLSWLQSSSCRAPAIEELRKARLPPPSSPEREDAKTACSDCWRCSCRLPGRILKAILHHLPWSQRRACALEHVAIGETCGQCSSLTCRTCSGALISKGDCADVAMLLVSAVRLLGCTWQSLTSSKQEPSSALSRLVDAAILFAPLALSCSVSYRVWHVRKLSSHLLDAEARMQQAQTVCKLRVALSLGLMATAGGAGKLPPVSRLDKWMSRASSSGLERSALRGLHDALVRYSTLLRAALHQGSNQAPAVPKQDAATTEGRTR